MALVPGDNWAAGDAYDAYMGRWSRAVARTFIDWMRPEPAANWLDVGCGTGALTSVICERAAPASVVACDSSEPFIEYARSLVTDPAVSFVVAQADSLPSRVGEFDYVVSALFLNFLPDPGRVIRCMRDRLRPGGIVASYVWDYARGMELLSAFWAEAVAGDPGATVVDERRRFPLCDESALKSLLDAAGFLEVQARAVEVETELATFDDYWTPFLRGTGPAPSYVASLDPEARDGLRERLRRRLPAGPDGRIRLTARAVAVRGSRP